MPPHPLPRCTFASLGTNTSSRWLDISKTSQSKLVETTQDDCGLGRANVWVRAASSELEYQSQKQSEEQVGMKEEPFEERFEGQVGVEGVFALTSVDGEAAAQTLYGPTYVAVAKVPSQIP